MAREREQPGGDDVIGSVAPEDVPTLRGEQKRRYLRAAFDRIAPRYDQMNWVISLGQLPRWRAAGLSGLDLGPGDEVLDVGCGPGTSSIWLRERYGCQVEGMDLSPGMIEQARARDPRGSYFVGDVESIPRDDGRYGAVTTVFTTRNFPDVYAALREMARVLTPGGTLVILDSFPPRRALWRRLQALWMRTLVPLLVAPFTDPRPYRYLAESVLQHITDERCAEALREMGFRDVRLRRFFFGSATAVVACGRPAELALES